MSNELGFTSTVKENMNEFGTMNRNGIGAFARVFHDTRDGPVREERIGGASVVPGAEREGYLFFAPDVSVFDRSGKTRSSCSRMGGSVYRSSTVACSIWERRCPGRDGLLRLVPSMMRIFVSCSGRTKNSPSAASRIHRSKSPSCTRLARKAPTWMRSDRRTMAEGSGRQFPTSKKC